MLRVGGREHSNVPGVLELVSSSRHWASSSYYQTPIEHEVLQWENSLVYKHLYYFDPLIL